jgi:hypothetical protein
MRWDFWDEIETLLDRWGIQPILAIVPDNQDPKLVVNPPNPVFWSRARHWQKKGWVIGQHGFRHVYDSRSPALVPWWEQSEFAGHPYQVQYARASAGLEALRAQRLEPSVWVAPSHSFDATTLKVLGDLGIRFLSDGCGFRPHRDQSGLTWIPQQPWKPPGLSFGVWTFTFHHNTLSTTEPVRRFAEANRGRLMGPAFRFDQLVADVPLRGTWDALYEATYWPVFRMRRRLASAVKRRRARA